MSTKYFCIYLEIEIFLTQAQAKLNFSTQQGKGKALKIGLESIRNKKMENPYFFMKNCDTAVVAGKECMYLSYSFTP